MQPLTRGRYMARLAEGGADVARAQALRHLAFYARRGRARPDGRDCDAFDATARHMLVEDCHDGTLLACYRVQVYRGDGVLASYGAQFYDLSRLASYPGPLMELGRFCLHPDQHDADILRLAWAAMARLVDDWGIALLFGCSSFMGADPARHAAALHFLSARVAPDLWRPGPRAPLRVSLGGWSQATGTAEIPALLRTYLGMGGWVSDHAVIDRDLDTLHVLTGVEIAHIPPARARALRQIAAESMG
ncbi:MAG: GNAT family N-acetyltransferase [Rhodobacteraceae bacterium]|nr:GNAT family N-acetyltransferase [Paracoccaceae bacterium]